MMRLRTAMERREWKRSQPVEIYKLTPDEIAGLRQTAPPRSPLNVLETELKSK